MHVNQMCPAGVVNVHIEGDLGCADLHTADAVCVFLSESDVINISPSLQGRLAALSKVCATGYTSSLGTRL